MARVEVILEDGMTINVQHKTRFGPIRRLQYEKMLVKQIPELQELKTPTSEAETVNSILDHQVEWALVAQVQKFVAVAERISYAAGEHFNMNEQFDDANLLAAFKHYQNGDPDNTFDLWIQIELKIAELDKPLTDDFKQPPDTVGALSPEAVSAAQSG